MRRRIWIGVAVATAIAGWLWCWPAVLGGQATYVTTHGISMEPGFHTGDLAVVRPVDRYAVGDVVAYRSELLDTLVMHRIVAVDNGKYTFKGDNNSWLDPEHPTDADLIGRLAAHVPQGGAWLDRLASPPMIAIAAFTVLTTGGTVAGTRKKRRRQRRTSMSRHITTRPGPLKAASAAPVRLRAAAAGVLLLGIAGLGLGAWSWTGPLDHDVASASPDAARMSFSYTAAVARTPAYDSTTVTSPDPVFRKVTDTVQVNYAYQGDPGTIAVTAELSTASGWHSSMPLAAPISITGTTHEGSVKLNLKALEARAQAAAAATGIPVDSVSIAVTTRVQEATGGTFQQALKLNLTPLQLGLAGDVNDLTSTNTAAVPAGASAPRTWGVAGWSISAANARLLSPCLLLAALLGGAALIRSVRLGQPTDEGAAIRRRYASLLVRVRPVSTAPGRPVIDVTAFATLAKLAERYGLLVLHWSRSGIETFIVQDENNIYRYRTGERTADASVPEPDISEPAMHHSDAPVPSAQSPRP